MNTAKDTRVLDTTKFIGLIREKLNLDNFSVYILKTTYPNTTEVEEYLITIYSEKLLYTFEYSYKPNDKTIRETNKELKRQNDKEGIDINELIAEKAYKAFMAHWISLAKKPTNNK